MDSNLYRVAMLLFLLNYTIQTNIGKFLSNVCRIFTKKCFVIGSQNPNLSFMHHNILQSFLALSPKTTRQYVTFHHAIDKNISLIIKYNIFRSFLFPIETFHEK